MIRALVIDDSAFMRKALSLMLEKDDDIKVVGTARDGNEGFEKVQQLKPDVVTLDIEMPRTNGLECIDLIMRHQPTPILVVSSVTTDGAQITLDALDRGAVDFIPKSQSLVAIDIIKIETELIAKIKTIARKSLHKRFRRTIRPPVEIRDGRSVATAPPEEIFSLADKPLSCVAIGVSTGGPPVVQTLLSVLERNFPVPIVVAQHMPKEFTVTFAKRLNAVCGIDVTEAADGEQLEPGHAYIGKGGDHLVLQRRGVRVFAHLTPEPRDHLYHPSADVLFESVAGVYGGNTLAIILTGMGKDGALGLQTLHRRGGRILAQNEESCVVYGMPKAAVDSGVTDAVLSIEGIAASLRTIGRRAHSESR